MGLTGTIFYISAAVDIYLQSHDWFQDLKGTLAKELDFVNEGRNGERCAKELKHMSFVYVPKILWNQTSKVNIYK